MTRYGVSLWLAGPPKIRARSWPRLEGDVTADVAVIGGGLTGCATAFALAAAGRRVALFEAQRIGQGATAASDGVIALEPWPLWHELEALFGRRDARLARETYRRAALEMTSILRRLGVRCSLEPRDGLSLARGEDGGAVLARDDAARRAAGLEATWVGGAKLRAQTGVASGRALSTAAAVTLDPYRACLGLARAAAARGCRVFESSPLGAASREKDGTALRFRSGTATAPVVVFATGAPPPWAAGLARHFRDRVSHHVATPPLPGVLRRELGVGRPVVRLADGAVRRLRWTRDDRLLFSAGDVTPVAPRSRAKALVQRTGQLMYELSLIYPAISGIQPDYGWDAPTPEAPDALPLVGPHRNYPGWLFALGADRAGAGSAWLAARLLLRHVSGGAEKGDDLFGFRRLR